MAKRKRKVRPMVPQDRDYRAQHDEELTPEQLEKLLRVRQARRAIEAEQRERDRRMQERAELEARATVEGHMKPTPERGAHDKLERFEAAPYVFGKRVKLPTRLHWYEDRALITERMLDAGLRFREDHDFAIVADPRVISNYGQSIAGQAEFSDQKMDARRRYMRAFHALTATYRSVVHKVAVDDEWASGDLPKLREGLDALADHYGMARA